MLNFRPDTAPPLRRFAVVTLSLGCLCRANAAPEPSTAPAPVEIRSQPLAPPALASVDPVVRLLAEKGLVAESTAREAGAPEAARPQPGESRFVDRFRDSASEMVLAAMNFLGAPYQRGGNDAGHGFDCSGFTRHVFALSLGLVLPRRADEQATSAGLLAIDRAQLRPGDLVFFNTMRRTFSHVGIYVGLGRFIHSPKPGGAVRVDDLQATYWDRRFTGGRRAGQFVPVGHTETTTAPTAN